ncbi:MAG: ferrous iron transport protein A [Chlorobi bacterium]|nr:ferrous iron transport protein A [Chlorobiota bacterium]
MGPNKEEIGILTNQPKHKLLSVEEIPEHIAGQLKPLGIYEGAYVCILRYAPVGDPIIVATPTHVIAISRDIAQQIKVRTDKR